MGESPDIKSKHRWQLGGGRPIKTLARIQAAREAGMYSFCLWAISAAVHKVEVRPMRVDVPRGHSPLIDGGAS
jgi:hypothetical protein